MSSSLVIRYLFPLNNLSKFLIGPTQIIINDNIIEFIFLGNLSAGIGPPLLRE